MGKACERETGGKLQQFLDAQSLFAPEQSLQKNRLACFNQEV